MGDPAGDALEVEEVVVRYGGHVALDRISLTAPVGRVVGLIGPNGAGKTTCFNACSGLLRPASGRVRLFGHDVTHASPQRRAQLGMGRTFQRMELFESLTTLFARFPSLALAGEPESRGTFVLRGYHRVPVAAGG